MYSNVLFFHQCSAQFLLKLYPLSLDKLVKPDGNIVQFHALTSKTIILCYVNPEVKELHYEFAVMLFSFYRNV